MLLTPRPGETVTFRSRVAAFYRGKGYEVRENARVRGNSQNIYAVDMVASGPLGALLVSFGDAAGVDGPEVSRVRTMGRDIGATPVIATPTIEPDLRRLAAQMAVVVIDETALEVPAPLPHIAAPGLGPDVAKADIDAHPWPASGRAAVIAGPAHMEAVEVDEMVARLTQPVANDSAPSTGGLWKVPRGSDQLMAATAPVAMPSTPSPVAGAKFSWLGTGAPLDSAPKPKVQAMNAAMTIEHEATLTTRDLTLQERAASLLDSPPLPRWLKILFSVGAGFLLLFLLVKAFG